MTDSHALPATVHACMDALNSGALTSETLLESLLARVDAQNPKINAIVAQDREAARERARAADAARAAGENWGPLHGLPMTIKDTFEVPGMITAAGSPGLAGHRPQQAAEAVQRLIDAGAIIYGKTNVPYLAADFQSYNKVYGCTHNPWNTARTPGGSSGGAAAALAAGFTAAELGSDIGGSLRNPAHYCGVYSHKPSYGLISLRGHIPGPPGTLSRSDLAVAGPMARSAADLNLLMEVLAAPSGIDQRAWQLQLPDCDWPVERFRILAWLEDPSCPTEAAQHQQLQAAAKALQAAGAQVDYGAPQGVPGLREQYGEFLKLLAAVMGGGAPAKLYRQMQWASRWARLRGKVAPDSLLGYATAGTQSHRDWLRANEKREQLRAAWETVFEKYDLILMPVTPTPAPRHQHEGNLFSRKLPVNGVPRPYADHMSWIAPATLNLQPVTTAPVGMVDGLPVGLQIVGPYLQDRRCIRLAEHLQQLLPAMAYPEQPVGGS